MDRRKERELLQLIADQDQKLKTYKTKFHDVVGSYKNLLKEKEALQESVKVLTESNAAVQDKEGEADFATGPISTKALTEQPVSKKDSNFGLDSLKNHLRTLTEENTRLETETKADRKRLLREIEQLQQSLKEKENSWSDQKSKLENSSKQLKRQIREQQNERDKEQQNQALMLKELQSLVADERSAKEKLEQQIETLKLALEKLPDKRQDYERCINELRSELQKTKDSLEVAEREEKELPVLLKRLQQEIYELREGHYKAVDREVNRANEAEDQLKTFSAVSEERSSSLEQRLSELSQIVGSYDKLRQQDQIAIQKLKERVAQLDQENSVLARNVSALDKGCDFENEASLDVPAILDKITKLKGYLQAANQKSKKPINIAGILNEIQRDTEVNPHAACEKELMQLREELEQRKFREQLAKSEHMEKPESSAEVSSLKEQLHYMKEELHIYKLQQKAEEEQYEKSEHNFHNCVKEMLSRHEQELSMQRHDYQVKVLELEQQLQKQRERSILLLEDKDKEIVSLKSRMPVLHIRKESCQDGMENYYDETELAGWPSGEDEHLSDLISASTIPSTKGRQLLHYAQEMARKDVEICNLRRARTQAESALRELQQMEALNTDRSLTEIDMLKSKIMRLESAAKGVNMEYLKNVVLRFIKCTSRSGRSHMLNAIAAILHFTTIELGEARIGLHVI